MRRELHKNRKILSDKDSTQDSLLSPLCRKKRVDQRHVNSFVLAPKAGFKQKKKEITQPLKGARRE